MECLLLRARGIVYCRDEGINREASDREDVGHIPGSEASSVGLFAQDPLREAEGGPTNNGSIT